MSLLAVQGGATGTGTVTLLAPVTNTNRTITLPDETGTVLTTATAGVPINGPAFSAYRTANQSISVSTATKIQFNNELFDTNSCFDSATNYRFTPTVAGYYQVNGCGGIISSASNVFFLQLFKNGSIYVRGSQTPFNTNGTLSVLSTLVYLNGTTDYIEMYVNQQGGATENLLGDIAFCYFQAAMVRSAI